MGTVSHVSASALGATKRRSSQSLFTALRPYLRGIEPDYGCAALVTESSKPCNKLSIRSLILGPELGGSVRTCGTGDGGGQETATGTVPFIAQLSNSGVEASNAASVFIVGSFFVLLVMQGLPGGRGLRLLAERGDTAFEGGVLRLHRIEPLRLYLERDAEHQDDGADRDCQPCGDRKLDETPLIHISPAMQRDRSCSRRLTRPGSVTPRAVTQRRSSSQAPTVSPALSFRRSVDLQYAVPPTL